MSTARPDTSRCREPQCPGHRFGPCVTRTQPSPNHPRALFGAFITGALLLAGPIHAADDDAPISLSNADVVRLHAQEGSAAPSARPAAPAPTSQPSPTAASDAADEAALRAMDRELKARLDALSRRSMGNVARALDARVLGDDAPAVPPISAGPNDRDHEAAMPAAPADVGQDEAEDEEPHASAQGRVKSEPACMYGPRGHLLHAPTGRTCAPVRHADTTTRFYGTTSNEDEAEASSLSRKSTAEKASQVGCVYGSRGQLIYSSPGVECAAG